MGDIRILWRRYWAVFEKSPIIFAKEPYLWETQGSFEGDSQRTNSIRSLFEKSPIIFVKEPYYICGRTLFMRDTRILWRRLTENEFNSVSFSKMPYSWCKIVNFSIQYGLFLKCAVLYLWKSPICGRRTDLLKEIWGSFAGNVGVRENLTANEFYTVSFWKAVDVCTKQPCSLLWLFFGGRCRTLSWQIWGSFVGNIALCYWDLLREK